MKQSLRTMTLASAGKSILTTICLTVVLHLGCQSRTAGRASGGHAGGNESGRQRPAATVKLDDLPPEVRDKVKETLGRWIGEAIYKEPERILDRCGIKDPIDRTLFHESQESLLGSQAVPASIFLYVLKPLESAAEPIECELPYNGDGIIHFTSAKAAVQKPIAIVVATPNRQTKGTAWTNVMQYENGKWVSGQARKADGKEVGKRSPSR